MFGNSRFLSVVLMLSVAVWSAGIVAGEVATPAPWRPGPSSLPSTPSRPPPAISLLFMARALAPLSRPNGLFFSDNGQN